MAKSDVKANMGNNKGVKMAGNQDQERKTENQRLLHALSKDPEARKIYVALAHKHKAKFKALWKEGNDLP